MLMVDYKDIIAKNLIYYRKAMKLTQLELAEKINYSDKAVSKWERAEGIPDAIVLKELADIFGITVDAFFSQELPKISKNTKLKNVLKKRTFITLCSLLLVWLVATVTFTFIMIFAPHFKYSYFAFIYAIPVSAIVLTVFNGLWGKRWAFIPILTVLIWSIALSLYLSISNERAWLLFLICIPLEALTIIFYSYNGKLNKKNVEKEIE